MSIRTIVLLTTALIILSMSIHYVREDQVGVYWRGGEPLEWFTDPGVHFMFPGTYYSSIQSKNLKEQIELFHMTRIQLLVVKEKLKIQEAEAKLHSALSVAK